VIRRHPDIKLLRRAADIAELASRQARMLSALWPMLRRGGMLVYATCSVLRQENAQVALAWLRSQGDAALELPIEAQWGLSCPAGRQILPGEHDMDGFYYFRVQKR
jgi:16S rRNA (cytosine967-C5)-methyltransferase